MSLAGVLADSVARSVPFAPQVALQAALLPPALRGRISYRLFAALARRVSLPPLVTTNMGIERRLRCRVPPSSHMTVFGAPSLYRGERGTLELAAALARDSDAFVDIGAHLGYFTFFVRSRCPATPIHFFEPDAALYELLCENVRANQLPQVHGSGAAVAAASGEAVFYRNLSDALSGSLTTLFAHSHSVEAVAVPTQSYADFAAGARVTRACVKVDVEGAEQQFLEGAVEALDTIDSLIIEILPPAIERGFVATVCELTGFHPYYVNDYRLEHAPGGRFRNRPPNHNWLFCRLVPSQLRDRLHGSRVTVA